MAVFATLLAAAPLGALVTYLFAVADAPSLATMQLGMQGAGLASACLVRYCPRRLQATAHRMFYVLLATIGIATASTCVTDCCGWITSGAVFGVMVVLAVFDRGCIG